MARTMNETIENVRYWKAQTEGWIEHNVHGKGGVDVTGIAGDVVVTLDGGWSDSDVRALRDGLVDGDVPVYATRGTRQVRIEATDDRLSVPYST